MLSVEHDHALVECAPLVWDGTKVTVGPVAVETARTGIDGVGLSAAISVGDRVALHWDWVCDVISDKQRGMLDRYTVRHLGLVNAVLVERRLTAAGHG